MQNEPLKIPISKQLFDRMMKADDTTIVAGTRCPICNTDILIYPLGDKYECPKCGKQPKSLIIKNFFSKQTIEYFEKQKKTLR